VPLIADRVIVLGEDRRVLADGTPEAVLADTALLLRANLIHEHLHGHGRVLHSHPHEPDDAHHDPCDGASETPVAYHDPTGGPDAGKPAGRSNPPAGLRAIVAVPHVRQSERDSGAAHWRHLYSRHV
jgi:hypothetical protein